MAQLGTPVRHNPQLIKFLVSGGKAMTTLSIANRDMLYSLSWYMSTRQTALRAALSFRTQLSVTEQTDMRVHYSSYFLNLLAATELFRETTTLQPNDFEAHLYSRLVVTARV